MRLFGILCAIALLVVAVVMASTSPEAPELQQQWLSVLGAKKKYQDSVLSGAADKELKRQQWADAVVSFVHLHPDHGRARAVHEEIVLHRARELAAAGRQEEAVSFYRALLARNQNSETPRKELQELLSRKTLTREKISQLRAGMSRREVIGILGEPPVGWTRQTVRGQERSESIYYPAGSGTVAALFFTDDELFAAECDGRIDLQKR